MQYLTREELLELRAVRIKIGDADSPSAIDALNLREGALDAHRAHRLFSAWLRLPMHGKRARAITKKVWAATESLQIRRDDIILRRLETRLRRRIDARRDRMDASRPTRVAAQVRINAPLRYARIILHQEIEALRSDHPFTNEFGVKTRNGGIPAQNETET